MFLYLYFYRSDKCHVEFQKLASLMKTKENKIFKTTHWISMTNPTRKTLKESKAFVVKIWMDMTLPSGKNDKCLAVASDNFDTLLDLELLMSLCCF